MERITYKGLVVCNSVGHGKAVKGTKETATIQVRMLDGSGGYLLVHEVRHKANCPPCEEEAKKKALAWVDKMIETQEEFERCKVDRDYFMEKYVKKHTTAGQIQEAGEAVQELGTVILNAMWKRLPLWMRMKMQEPTKSLDA